MLDEHRVVISTAQPFALRCHVLAVATTAAPRENGGKGISGVFSAESHVFYEGPADKPPWHSDGPSPRGGQTTVVSDRLDSSIMRKTRPARSSAKRKEDVSNAARLLLSGLSTAAARATGFATDGRARDAGFAGAAGPAPRRGSCHRHWWPCLRQGLAAGGRARGKDLPAIGGRGRCVAMPRAAGHPAGCPHERQHPWQCLTTGGRACGGRGRAPRDLAMGARPRGKTLPASSGEALPRSRHPAVANARPPTRGDALSLEAANLPKPFLSHGKALSRARPCVTTPSLAPSAGKACRRIGRPRPCLAAADMSGHCHVPDQQRQRVATGPAARNKAFTPWPPTCSAVSAACVEASPRRGEPCVAKRCRWAGRPRQGRVTETAARP